MENRLLFDWLSFTGAVDNFDSIIRKLGLEKFKNRFILCPHGRNSYKTVYNFQGITVLCDPVNSDMYGVMVDICGQGCRFFENNSDISFYDLFKILMSENPAFSDGQTAFWKSLGYEYKPYKDMFGHTQIFTSYKDYDIFFERYYTQKRSVYHITRLDVAYDDFCGLLPLDIIAEKTRNEDYSSLCRHTAVEEHCEDHIKSKTVYFGKRISNFMCRFYDKKAEQDQKSVKNKEEPEFSPDTWTRCEIVLKGDRKHENALIFVKMLMGGMNLGSAFSSVISAYICFKEPSNDKNRSRRETSGFWSEFISNAERLTRPARIKEDYTISKMQSYSNKLSGFLFAYFSVTPIEKIKEDLFNRQYDYENEEYTDHPINYKYRKIINEHAVENGLLSIFEKVKEQEEIIEKLNSWCNYCVRRIVELEKFAPAYADESDGEPF